MVRILLFVAAAGMLVFGFKDYQRSILEAAAPARAPEDCRMPGPAGAPTRVLAGEAPVVSIVCMLKGAPADQPVKFVLQSLGKPKTGRTLVVRLVQADAAGAPTVSGWRAGPVNAVLLPMPAQIVPADASVQFPEGSPIAYLESEYQPSANYPMIMIAAGFVGLGFLLFPILFPKAPAAGSAAGATPAAWPPDERLPFHTVEPDVTIGTILAVVCLAAVAGAVIPRKDRLGGPGVFENPLVVLVASAVAFGAGHAALKKSGTGATLCLGGILLSEDPEDASGFLRWDDVTSLTRVGKDYSFLLRTASGGVITLDMGKGPEAERVACCLGAFLKPWILPRLREQVMTGKEVDFVQLRLSVEAIGWALTKEFRMNEFDDIQTIRVNDGVMGFKLPASDYEDMRVNYQELENGYLLPILLLTGKRSSVANCKLTFKTPGVPPDIFLGAPMQLTGTDAWISAFDTETSAVLARHGQFYLEQAEAAEAAGDSNAGFALTNRAIAYFEATGQSTHGGIATTQLAFGHYMLGRRQPAMARDSFERAAKLMEAGEIPNQTSISRALQSLAVARLNAKDPEAGLADAKRALALINNRPGVPVQQVLTTLNTLAGLHQTQGHPGESQEAMEKLLTLLENTDPALFPQGFEKQVFAYMQNFSQVCVDLQDKELMVQIHRRGVMLCRKLFGQDSVLVAQALFSLGTSQLAYRKYDDACMTLEEAVAISESKLGDKHPWLAGCLDRLGEAYWYTAKREEAESAWEISAAMAKALKKPEKPAPPEPARKGGHH